MDIDTCAVGTGRLRAAGVWAECLGIRSVFNYLTAGHVHHSTGSKVNAAAVSGRIRVVFFLVINTDSVVGNLAALHGEGRVLVNIDAAAASNRAGVHIEDELIVGIVEAPRAVSGNLTAEKGEACAGGNIDTAAVSFLNIGIKTAEIVSINTVVADLVIPRLGREVGP